MKPIVSMREALSDPTLLGHALPGESWLVWRVLLIAAMGEALTDDELAIFTRFTGRSQAPVERVDEIWAIVGRRGGKTRCAGTLAAYVGGLCDHESYLAPGERGVIPILAASTYQAGKAFNHARGVLEASLELAAMLDGDPTSDTIRLTNRVDIEVRPANFKTVRSITAVAAIADEVAFWSIEGSANPDEEILSAIRPALATTGGPLMVISSPYAKKGSLYQTWQRQYGPAGDPLILVARGATRDFNPSLSQRVVDRAYAQDAARASAEYGGEWRSDVTGFIDRDIVEALISRGVHERMPVNGVRYYAFLDPAGGSGQDSMCMAIAHDENGIATLDLIREKRPPFSPEAVVEEFCDVIKSYGISEASGDRWGGDFAREPFRKRGVNYATSDKSKSEIYLATLPRLNSGKVDLLDDERLVSQLTGLERRVARGGRESVDHAPTSGSHDDRCNAACGALDLVAAKPAFHYGMLEVV